MTYLIFMYIAYVCVCLPLIIWLARTLSRNGAVFLEDVFADNPKLATTVNHLLVVGFYLLNLGYACLMLRSSGVHDATGAVEALAFKLGQLLFTLGGMHFFNLYLFHKIRRRAQLAQLPPPVAAQMRLDPHEEVAMAR